MLLRPHLLEDIMVTLLEEDGVFRSYVDACQLEQMAGVCIVCFVAIDCNRLRTFWTWLVFHPLFSGCPLLGACFLPPRVISAYAKSQSLRYNININGVNHRKFFT